MDDSVGKTMEEDAFNDDTFDDEDLPQPLDVNDDDVVLDNEAVVVGGENALAIWRWGDSSNSTSSSCRRNTRMLTLRSRMASGRQRVEVVMVLVVAGLHQWCQCIQCMECISIMCWLKTVEEGRGERYLAGAAIGSILSDILLQMHCFS